MENNKIRLGKEGEVYIAIEQTKSKYIYHYTNNLGLMGIIKNNCFWVSRSDFLNDSMEIKYLKEVLKSSIEDLKQSFDSLVHKRDGNGNILRLIIDQLEIALRKYNEIYLQYAKKTFVLSMSENNDSLVLFSNYSNGDGYNLGIDLERFTDLLIQEKKNIIQKGKVNYNKIEQKNIVINDIMDEYIELINFLTKGKHHPSATVMSLEIQKFFNLINYKLLNYSIYFKNPSFHHEEEFRFAFMLDEKDICKSVKFRPFKSIIIPYIEIKLDNKLPIKHITIGPKNNIDIAKKSIETFIEYNGYNTTSSNTLDIIKSQIPLRY